VRQQTALSTVVFTGYTWDEVQRLPHGEALLASVDVLLAGRYDASQRLARGLRGSANKTVHFLTGRYTAADLATVPPAEVIIAPGGIIEMTGIDPLSW
jgi:anaerobic ribonucleoside-triphosphate reductase activating protein